jgi:basic membrane protein A
VPALKKAEASIAGVEAKVAVSADDAALLRTPRLSRLSGAQLYFDCWLAKLAQATSVPVATANKGIDFAIVGNPPVDQNWTTSSLPNVKPILFSTEQAAFFGRIPGCGCNQDRKGRSFWWHPEAPVKAFLDGFSDGIDRFNADNSASVQLLGWNKAKQDGTFSVIDTDIAKGKTLSEQFISQGADIILPVAGQVGEGAGAAALEHAGTSVIWVDSDGIPHCAGSLRSRSCSLRFRRI